MKQTPPTGTLRRSVRMHHVVAIGVGSSVGVSIFGVLAPASSIAGPGLLVSLLLAAVPMAFFAFTYAFLSSAAPACGASFIWPTRFIGPLPGFMVAWLRILGSTAAIVQHGVVLVLYVDASSLLHISPQIFMIALFTIFYGVNLVGVGAAAKVHTTLTVLLIGLLVFYSGAGLSSVQTANLVPFAPHGAMGIVLAIPVLAGLFIGVEFAAEMGEEIKDVGRVIAPGLTISVIAVLAIYGLVSLVTLGVIGSPVVSASDAPLLAAGKVFLGRWSGTVLGVAAAVAIATSLNGILLIFSRFLFAMGRDGLLPTALGRVHPRWGTPHIAMTVVYGLSIAGTFLPNDLLFLFLAVNIPTMLKYAASSLAAIRLVRNRPDLHQASIFKPSASAIRIIASLGIVCAVMIALVGAKADWRPYLILAIWGNRFRLNRHA